MTRANRKRIFLAAVLIGLPLVLSRGVFKDMIESVKIAFGGLSDSQQRGVNEIIRAFDTFGDGDRRKLIYILATSWNETKFKSIKEFRATTPGKVKDWQDRYWYTGFYGRGLSQLTWKSNYEQFSKILGIDIVNSPDIIMDPSIGADILVYGMMNGSFTGKKLSDYINASKKDYYNARQTTNLLFKAREIEGYAKAIEKTFI